jgi:hypothetical protein
MNPMRSPASAALCVVPLLAGCGAIAHGPATRAVSTMTEARNVMTSVDEVDRQTVRESRLSDADGHEWTQTEVVSTERVPLKQIEAELFEEALRASDEQGP